MATTLSLVVLRTQNVERLRNFYQALGLDFTEEKHGSGPTHYACSVGSIVFEVYPSNRDQSPSAPALIGFTIASIDRIIDSLVAAGGTVVKAPAESPWGRRAIVRDPDGNQVDLTEE